MFRRMMSIVIGSVVLMSAGAYGQQAPAAEPGKLLEKQPYVLGPVQAQEYPEQNFLFVSSEATQKTMRDVMMKVMPHLVTAAKTAGVEAPSGPIVIVFNGISPNPDAAFEVEVGFIVPDTVKAAGDAEVRKLESFRCASVLFTGKPDTLGKAFETLFQTMMASGKMPTMSIRQLMLYWEGEESTNNVILLQAEIQ